MDVAWDQSQLIYKNILRWLKRALFLPWVKFIVENMQGVAFLDQFAESLGIAPDRLVADGGSLHH